MPRQPLRSPDSPIERTAASLRALPALTFLGSSLLTFNAAQTASTLLLPFSRRRFRAFNRWAADQWWGWCVTIAKRMYGTRTVLTGDELPVAENAIVVANHQQMPDINFLMFPAREKQRLGDMKWMLKDVIKYVPGIGWGMLFLDNLFVRRDWTRDQASIERTFARLVEGGVPVWLMMFPEGTRLTAEKLESSQAWAREHDLQPPEHVLLPRTKGFAAAVQGLRDHVGAVYDFTIGYPDGVPTLWQYAVGYVREAHLHVRRYPIHSLPEDADEIAAWIRSRFQEKDRLLADFYRTGRFPTTS